MRKNGSRLISIKQYRFTDLFIFAVILVLGEAFPYLAKLLMPGAAVYTLSFAVPISLLVMMRWGWPSVFYAALSGVIYCLLNGGGGRDYLVYGLGNAFIELLLISFLIINKQKIAKKWYHSLWFAVAGWLLVYLGRSLVWTASYAVSPVDGAEIYSAFVAFIATDFLSLVMSAVIILAARRFDGLFEDQLSYLKRLDEERRERMRRDEFGDEPVEIDEETLDILNRDNDLY